VLPVPSRIYRITFGAPLTPSGSVGAMAIPEFILALRSRIGTDLLWLPGVSAVVVNGDGQLLLARRADNGLWAVVSGILEPGEEPAAAALRETLEETGAEVEVVRVSSVDVTDPVTYPNGDVCQFVDICFLCRYLSGELHPADGENTEVAWFAPGNLPTDMTASSRTRIAAALSGSAEAHFTRP
jgi:8-oxo-dGTP pyrophosphatase MutT (NUDIX family)